MAKRDITYYPGGAPIAPIHPGQALRDELDSRGLSSNPLALALRVPANLLSAIINGKRSISAETALRLGRYFGTGATFWMNLQARYDLAVAERDIGPRITREVEVAA
jgi:antitoxin HigA-1